MALYLLKNGPMQTTAAAAAVGTGAAIKTMFQFEPSATTGADIVEWGFSFDAPASVTTGKIELIETDVAATVTALVANDITKFASKSLSGGDPTTNLVQVGTANSGYTATVEGSITVVRSLDAPLLVTTTSGFIFAKQFPLGREPWCQVSKFTRIRVTFTVAVNMYCYLIVEV